ncbi:MAG TPA: hypothetical protein VLZ83_02450 [Edaphocola sp.]|nr:hypothetical protein [Edaphocola sp.]
MILRKLLVNILMVALFFATFKNSIYLTFYEINQEYFVNLLCENNDKPELNCNGQCQLDHIADDLSNEEKQVVLLNHSQDIILFFEDVTLSIDVPVISKATKLVKIGFRESQYKFDFLSKNSRPPVSFS